MAGARPCRDRPRAGDPPCRRDPPRCLGSPVGRRAGEADRRGAGRRRGRWGGVAAADDLVVVGSDLADVADLAGSGAGDGDDALVDTAKPDDPALICFTSGTTGRPKGDLLRHRNLVAGAGSVAVAWGWTEEDRLVHALSIFHAHGLCVGLLSVGRADHERIGVDHRPGPVRRRQRDEQRDHRRQRRRWELAWSHDPQRRRARDGVGATSKFDGAPSRSHLI